MISLKSTTLLTAIRSLIITTKQQRDRMVITVKIMLPADIDRIDLIPAILLISTVNYKCDRSISLIYTSKKGISHLIPCPYVCYIIRASKPSTKHIDKISHFSFRSSLTSPFSVLDIKYAHSSQSLII